MPYTLDVQSVESSHVCFLRVGVSVSILQSDGRKRVMIESMAQAHMTETEVAIIRSPLPEGRLLSQCIAIAEARGSSATLDEGFMKDVEEGIARRSQPWKPPAWE